MSLNEHSNIESVVVSAEKPEEYPESISVIYPSDNHQTSNSIWALLNWMKEIVNEFDIVVAHHTRSGLFGTIVARLDGIPVIAREGNDHRRFPYQVRAARTLTNILCDEIICVSQSVANSYTGFERIVPNSKFTVINNGVDMDGIDSAKYSEWDIYSEANINPDTPVIGTAGMLIEQKNQKLLIESLEHLILNKGYDLNLVIAGDGYLRATLEQKAKDRGIEDSVHFLGYLQRNNVYKMLHQIDCYAMPSRWEGFSAAGLQAMAVGVPCVFSDIDSFNSQYPDDLVYFHDPESVTDLANALEKSLDGSKDINDRGRKFVLDNHTKDIMAKEYVNIIQKSIQKS